MSSSKVTQTRTLYNHSFDWSTGLSSAGEDAKPGVSAFADRVLCWKRACVCAQTRDVHNPQSLGTIHLGVCSVRPFRKICGCRNSRMEAARRPPPARRSRRNQITDRRFRLAAPSRRRPSLKQSNAPPFSGPAARLRIQAFLYAGRPQLGPTLSGHPPEIRRAFFPLLGGSCWIYCRGCGDFREAGGRARVDAPHGAGGCRCCGRGVAVGGGGFGSGRFPGRRRRSSRTGRRCFGGGGRSGGDRMRERAVLPR